MTEASLLQSTVINGGYCIGCGACAAFEGSPSTIAMDPEGRLQAKIAAPADIDLPLRAVCPFSDLAVNEDQIGEELFSSADAAHDTRLGWYSGVWAGHVAEGEFRERGSSGGMGNWLASELLRTGEVDAVVHVRPDTDGNLFGFTISRTLDELQAGAKSRYYPIEMSKVLRYISDTPGRYALVGVPCFIKAARLFSRQDDKVRDRLRYTISLVCGHLKSEGFSEMFAWQLGVQPEKVESIDFRVKNRTGKANQYSIRATGPDRTGRQVDNTAQNKKLFGHLWGHGLFKYRACDYCDDVFGETADVTVGDAWLPGLVDDPMGANVVVSRNLRINQLIEDGVQTGRLQLDVISADDAAKSQDAGLRHRRQGLAVRLAKAKRRGRWTPPKRIEPGTAGLNRRLQRVYEIRETLSERSHRAFMRAKKAAKFSRFVLEMQPLMTAHDLMNKPKSMKSTIKTIIQSVRIIVNSRKVG